MVNPADSLRLPLIFSLHLSNGIHKIKNFQNCFAVIV